MIFGIGTDIVQIPRIERIFSVYKNHFATKILSTIELTKMSELNAEKHVSFLAKRFAAKEAVSKALGTGIRGNLTFKNIIISNNDLGKPIVEINSMFLKNISIHLSISDDYPTCVAFAIALIK